MYSNVHLRVRVCRNGLSFFAVNLKIKWGGFGSDKIPGLKKKRETPTVKEMKLNSPTEGEISHAHSSITQNRDGGNYRSC
jgi:hypothetical protein